MILYIGANKHLETLMFENESELEFHSWYILMGEIGAAIEVSRGSTIKTVTHPTFVGLVSYELSNTISLRGKI